MYKVTRSFVDLQDNGYRYQVGDVYPRQGAKLEDTRLMELSTNKNKMGTPLIKREPERVPEKATGDISEALEDSNTGEHPVEQPEAKKKPRKSEKK